MQDVEIGKTELGAWRRKKGVNANSLYYLLNFPVDLNFPKK